MGLMEVLQMHFKCSHTWEDGCKDTWDGHIDSLVNYGGYCEISISSRSSIHLIFGVYSRGLFACVPNYGGTYLSNKLDDVFYNSERLTKVFDNIIDGITAAKALATIANQIKF
jgi:hypothetical protein